MNLDGGLCTDMVTALQLPPRGTVQPAFFISCSFSIFGFGRHRAKISAGVLP